MESQWVVACRALIMFACLLAFPLAAVLGVRLPKETWRVVDVVKDRASELFRDARPERPPVLATSEPLQLRLPPARSPRGAAAPPDHRVAAPRVAALPFDVASHDPQMALQIQNELPAASFSEMPVGQIATAAGDELALLAGSPAFQAVQAEMTALGAVTFAVESWGISGGLYRCRSDVAVYDDPNYQRHFQAVEGDPMLAMQAVLAQVQTWRASTTR